MSDTTTSKIRNIRDPQGTPSENYQKPPAAETSVASSAAVPAAAVGAPRPHRFEGLRASDTPAAKRRKNAAQGASRGSQVGNEQARRGERIAMALRRSPFPRLLGVCKGLRFTRYL